MRRRGARFVEVAPGRMAWVEDEPEKEAQSATRAPPTGQPAPPIVERASFEKRSGLATSQRAEPTDDAATLAQWMTTNKVV